MPLAITVAVCLLLSLPASATAIRASFTAVAQDSQSAFTPDNSTRQQPAAPETNPPPAASPQEQTAPPSEPPQDAAKPAPAGGASQTTAPPEPSPAAGQEPQATQPATPKAKPAAPKKKPASTAKRKTAGRSQKAKSSPAAAKPGEPSKVVVKNGSAAEPSTQLAPGLSQQQASSKRQGTDQLLASTDENLKKISGRPLPSNQQDMVQQIRNFMEQAKAATNAGDLDRAHNLALKASLLAQELAKP
jgi:hypothetical protein